VTEESNFHDSPKEKEEDLITEIVQRRGGDVHVKQVVRGDPYK